MKNITAILALSLCSVFGQSQILDVYRNKEYAISSYVLSAEIKKDYSPSELEIIHDKNNDTNEVWTKIEDQFFALVVATVNNEVDFFQLNSKAIKYQNQLEEWNRLQGYNTRYSTNPKFTSVDIKLISVLNNCGIYSINYNFEINVGDRRRNREVPIRKHYVADFEKNTISEINDLPSTIQQNKLKELTLSKFKTLYLLKTLKIDLGNLEQIENNNDKIGLDIDSKLHFSEALVYPFLNGIIVEFPENSKSSKHFSNESFRVYLKGDEVQQLLKVYPVFNPAFKNELGPTSKIEMDQLSKDENYDLQRFRTAPKELQMVDILNFDRKIYTMQISSYQLKDTNRRFMSTKKVFLDKQQNIDKIEHFRENKKIRLEEIYRYNANYDLESIKTTGKGKSLELFHYNNGGLDYTEKYQLEIESDYNKKYVDLDIQQTHLIYSFNYQYTFRLNLVGKFSHRNHTQYRFVEKNQFCTNSFCILTDENQNTIGVKQKKHGLIEVLTNEKNQPLESYFDNDRRQHFFTYDEQGRIKKIISLSDSKNSNIVEYEYELEQNKALIIREKRLSYSNETVIAYEYTFKFW